MKNQRKGSSYAERMSNRLPVTEILSTLRGLGCQVKYEAGGRRFHFLNVYTVHWESNSSEASYFKPDRKVSLHRTDEARYSNSKTRYIVDFMINEKTANAWRDEISSHPRLNASNCRVRVKDRLVLNEKLVLQVYNAVKGTFDSKEDAEGSQYSFDLFEGSVKMFNEWEEDETTLFQMINFLNHLGFQIEKREDFDDWVTENMTYALDTYNCEGFEPKNPASIGPFGMKGQNIIWVFITEYDAFLELKRFREMTGFKTEEHSNSIKLLDENGAVRMQMRPYPGSTLVLNEEVIKKTYQRAIRLLGIDKDDESGIIKGQTLL